MSSEEVGQGAFVVVKQKGKICTKRVYNFNLLTVLREVNNIYRLNHPNVITIDQITHSDDRFNITMPCVGRSLERLIPLPKKSVMSTIEQLLRVVDYIHKQGVWHRDIKPHNLVIDDAGKLTLIDFGASKDFYYSGLKTPGRTTYWFAAPELLLESTEYTSLVDEWSVGVVIYALIIGKYLFSGDSLTEILFNVFSIVGTPTRQQLDEMKADSNIPKYSGIGINLDNKIIEGVVTNLLQPYPGNRITCAQAYKILFDKELPTYKITYIIPRFGRPIAIDYRWKEILINWLIEVRYKLELDAYTLINAVMVVDKYTSLFQTNSNNYQLVGVVALFLADKLRGNYLDEEYAIFLTDYTYSENQFYGMMFHMLKVLDYKIDMVIDISEAFHSRKQEITLLNTTAHVGFINILYFLLFSQYLTDIKWYQTNKLISLFWSAYNDNISFGSYQGVVKVLKPLMLKYSGIIRDKELVTWITKL